MSDKDANIQNAIAALRSVNPYERFAAIETLARHHYTDALDHLIAATVDSHMSVREAAVWALGDMGLLASATTLYDIATDNQQPEVLQIAAFYGLGALGDVESIPMLFRVYHNATLSQSIRDAAGRALLRYGDALVHPLLSLYNTAGIGDGERISVLTLLGKVGSPLAINALIDAARLGSSRVRWAAVQAMGEIGDPAPTDMLIGLLSSAPELGRIVIWSLEHIGDARGLRAARRWRELQGFPDDDTPDLPPVPPRR